MKFHHSIPLLLTYVLLENIVRLRFAKARNNRLMLSKATFCALVKYLREYIWVISKENFILLSASEFVMQSKVEFLKDKANCVRSQLLLLV